MSIKDFIVRKKIYNVTEEEFEKNVEKCKQALMGLSDVALKAYIKEEACLQRQICAENMERGNNSKLLYNLGFIDETLNAPIGEVLKQTEVAQLLSYVIKSCAIQELECSKEDKIAIFKEKTRSKHVSDKFAEDVLEERCGRLQRFILSRKNRKEYEKTICFIKKNDRFWDSVSQMPNVIEDIGVTLIRDKKVSYELAQLVKGLSKKIKNSWTNTNGVVCEALVVSVLHGLTEIDGAILLAKWEHLDVNDDTVFDAKLILDAVSSYVDEFKKNQQQAE